MSVVSLTTLVARARERADMPVAGFVPDSATGIYAWINEGVQALHEKLVAARGSEYVESSTTLTFDGTSTVYALPADFFKLLGVDIMDGGVTRSMLPFPRAERNLYNNLIAPWRSIPRYMLAGSNIRFLPAPAAGLGTLWYVPIAPLLGTATQTFLRFDGHNASSGSQPTVAASVTSTTGAGTIAAIYWLDVLHSTGVLEITTTSGFLDNEALSFGGTPSASALAVGTRYSGGATAVDFPDGWEKYIVAYAARQMLMKEESDTRAVDTDLARWDTEFEQMKQDRDAAFPMSAVDMDAVDRLGY